MKSFILGLLLVFTTCYAQADFVSNYAGKLTAVSPTIAISTATSTAMDLAGYTLVGIKFPASFTGTTVTFTMCDTLGGTYVPVYNSSGAISVTIAQARYYAIDPKDFQGIRYLKIVSGSSEAAARTLVVSIKGLN